MGKWQEDIKQIANNTEEYKEDLVLSLSSINKILTSLINTKLLKIINLMDFNKLNNHRLHHKIIFK
jgi:hypothetical protein